MTTIWKNKEESVLKDNQSMVSMKKAIEAGKVNTQTKETEIMEMGKQVDELKAVATEKVVTSSISVLSVVFVMNKIIRLSRSSQHVGL